MTKQPPLLFKIKSVNHLLLPIYLLGKLLLILALKYFRCCIQNYLQVFIVPLLLIFFQNCDTHDSSNKALISWFQKLAHPYSLGSNRYKHRLPLEQDLHQIQSLQYCVKTHNLILLLLKNFLPLFPYSTLTETFFWY